MAPQTSRRFNLIMHIQLSLDILPCSTVNFLKLAGNIFRDFFLNIKVGDLKKKF